MNPVTGEKIVHIQGARYVLRFTWRALAEIESKHGENPSLFSPEVLASVAESGFRANHPDLSAERIMELSPPIVPFALAVQEAIRWANFGPEGIPKTKATEKKSLLSAGGLWRHIKRLFRKVFPRWSSGA
jgi:hypothetical protein